MFHDGSEIRIQPNQSHIVYQVEVVEVEWGEWELYQSSIALQLICMLLNSGKLQPGEYHAAQISEKFNAPVAHSVLVEYERPSFSSSVSLDSNGDSNSVQDDLTRSPMLPERKQVL
jgi:hypothetical protein